MVPRLLLLGTPRLFDQNGAHVRLSARAYALTALLALWKDRVAPREALAHMLWGDVPGRFGSLRKLLWSIREATGRAGVDLIETDDVTVRLARRNLDVDVIRIAALEMPGHRPSLAEICRIYRGDLLEGIDLASDVWNDWLRGERSRLRALFIERASLEIDESAAPSPAIKNAARRLIDIDPYNETACRRLIKLFLAEGEKAQARRVYSDLVQRLRRDLHTDPAAETTQMVEALYIAEARPKGSTASGQDAVPNLCDIPSMAVRLGIPSICLLRPISLGRLGRLDHVAQSLIEDVTVGLCRSRSLRVLAPYSAWKISDFEKPEQGLIDLGLDYAVETVIQRVGDAVRLSFKLFRVASREIIWADICEFDPINDAAQRYRDLSRRVVASLQNEVERLELGRSPEIKSAPAYYWYLVGQKFMVQLDLVNIRRARQSFKTALAVSADFVPAITATARSFNLEWLLLSRGEEDILVKAEALARRAIAIDDQYAGGHRELGTSAMCLRRFDDSLAAFAAAEALNPQHADLLADYADALVHASEIPAALIKIHEAMELNPLCPDRYLWAEAGAQFFSENFQATLDAVQRMSDPSAAIRLQAAAHAMLHQNTEASHCVRQALDINPGFRVSHWLDIVPVRRKAQLRLYEYALLSAGFQ